MTVDDIIAVELGFMLAIDAIVAYKTVSHWGIKRYPTELKHKKRP